MKKRPVSLRRERKPELIDQISEITFKKGEIPLSFKVWSYRAYI
jgi:hypothetical protein